MLSFNPGKISTLVKYQRMSSLTGRIGAGTIFLGKKHQKFRIPIFLDFFKSNRSILL